MTIQSPPPSSPDAPATVELDLGFFWALWLLYLVTPRISIDGVEERRPWGKHRFALPPGRHQLEASYPWLFWPRTSIGRLTLDAVAGGHYRVRYRPSILRFLPGSLTLVAGPTLPAATAHVLPPSR